MAKKPLLKNTESPQQHESRLEGIPVVTAAAQPAHCAVEPPKLLISYISDTTALSSFFKQSQIQFKISNINDVSMIG